MAHDPYANLPEAPTFTLTSSSLEDGVTMPRAQVSGASGPGGDDALPQLTWSGAPEGTKSFVLTMYDPDAPTVSGFWHFAAFGIPADVTEMPEGAIALEEVREGFPSGATILTNDGGVRGFLGAAPPPGDAPHRYIVAVQALDTDELDVPADATPAFLQFNLLGHVLGRAFLTGTFGYEE
ncbi:YbhB/YbcL family Raf kinase inhibitor-like protein [Brachybacterium huguangmaarense]